jgi:1-phosphofructokinase family hexose kinase
VAAAEPLPGGKAAHVAIVAQALALDVTWVGFLGGATGEQCESGLSALEIPITVVRTRAETRSNLEIIARDGSVTEILEPGGAVTDGEVERMYYVCRDLFAESGKGSQVTLSGSLPPGAPSDFYAELIRLAHTYNCEVLLDTSGDTLSQTLEAAPDLVKPNRSEASAYAGGPVVDAAGAARVAMEMIAAGAGSVAVSLGPEGIVWASARNSLILISRPPAVAVRSTLGCGDAALAGFAIARARGLNEEDALCLAVACGTANCLADFPGLVDPVAVNKIMKEVTVQPLPADSIEARSHGGAR